MALSLFFAVFFYTTGVLFWVGLALRIALYIRTPAPLKIPTTPAPRTTSGVAFRLLREVVFFQSLFRSNLWLWAAGMAFHLGLLLVALRHLRYVLEPLPAWVVWVQPLGILGGFLMAFGLLGLWIRRCCVERIRYISTPSDHLMLVLLLLIATTGLLTRFVLHTDIVAIKAFCLGLLQFSLQPLPADPVILLHFLLAGLLFLIFPFSKLLHAPGLFFSPTRNQVDTPRESRHLAPWAASTE